MTKTVLLKDPDLPWEGPFPYDELAARLLAVGAAPVGPESTAEVIKDAFFDLMAGGSAPQEARAAWDALRLIDERLVADFFLYEVPEPDVDRALAELARSDPPVELPDFRKLADVQPDAQLLPPLPAVSVGRAPKLSVVTIEEPPLDLRLDDVDLFVFLEEADER